MTTSRIYVHIPSFTIFPSILLQNSHAYDIQSKTARVRVRAVVEAIINAIKLFPMTFPTSEWLFSLQAQLFLVVHRRGYHQTVVLLHNASFYCTASFLHSTWLGLSALVCWTFRSNTNFTLFQLSTMFACKHSCIHSLTIHLPNFFFLTVWW